MEYMTSNSIDDIEDFLEMEESLLELYTEVHATGCFKCSSSTNAQRAYPHDYSAAHECYDLCDSASVWSLTGQEWDSYFIRTDDADPQMTIDASCGRAFLAITDQLA